MHVGADLGGEQEGWAFEVVGSSPASGGDACEDLFGAHGVVAKGLGVVIVMGGVCRVGGESPRDRVAW